MSCLVVRGADKKDSFSAWIFMGFNSRKTSEGYEKCNSPRTRQRGAKPIPVQLVARASSQWGRLLQATLFVHPLRMQSFF